MNINSFFVGDKVSWTKISKSGKSISMRRMDGKIIGIAGNMAIVQYGRNNRTLNIDVSELRKGEQKSALSEFVEEVVKANR